MQLPRAATRAYQRAIWCGCILLIGCTPTGAEAPLKFEDAYTNQQVHLVIPPDYRGLRRGDALALILTIHSTARIVFPADFGVRMFSRSSQGWEEIAELPTATYPLDDIVFEPESNRGPDTVLVFPDIPEGREMKWLRVYVVGTIEEAGRTRPVAAYTDLPAAP